MHGEPTYRTWGSMINRCASTNDPNYGGRGISVCERWKTFENFLADMGMKPEGMTLDRIDNNGNYEPSNCRWATPIQQGNNRRNTYMVTAFGTTKSLREWSRDDICTVTAETIRQRIERGMCAELAIASPRKKGIK